MAFLSHALFREDVLLNRLFPADTSGFYIDIGACHPVGHSVTKAFSDRGWSGVNVEPGRTAFELLAADRTRDVNLNIGLSDRDGDLPFFEAVGCLGLSTFSPDWVRMWVDDRGQHFTERTVPVRTLAGVCRDHVGDRPIDFLKCTVEGYEDRVIRGGDWQRWRPRAVLVADRERDGWEPLLLASGYQYATFDGLSRYYIRAEDPDLLPRLRFPVNHHHDDYVFIDHHQQIEALRAELAAARLESAAGRAAHEGLPRQSTPAEELGPMALGLARWVRRTSRRHPRLASAVKRVAGVAGWRG